MSLPEWWSGAKNHPGIVRQPDQRSKSQIACAPLRSSFQPGAPLLSYGGGGHAAADRVIVAGTAAPSSKRRREECWHRSLFPGFHNTLSAAGALFSRPSSGSRSSLLHSRIIPQHRSPEERTRACACMRSCAV
ncbi:hypothetical protein MTO96_002526 [Rhipicephalus appendiculatus]